MRGDIRHTVDAWTGFDSAPQRFRGYSAYTASPRSGGFSASAFPFSLGLALGSVAAAPPPSLLLSVSRSGEAAAGNRALVTLSRLGYESERAADHRFDRGEGPGGESRAPLRPSVADARGACARGDARAQDDVANVSNATLLTSPNSPLTLPFPPGSHPEVGNRPRPGPVLYGRLKETEGEKGGREEEGGEEEEEEEETSKCSKQEKYPDHPRTHCDSIGFTRVSGLLDLLSS